ncbi:hypothetical protein O181_013201 [Austropuccinia psidii MF-1]|uniref:Uncharacterized protein n=1 Tax=Austropuccinia psidii MF-1 TaxID=1389203 RepID=A0A9Q3GN00_9BASI|nr:hypothetical protein [Austropuccinia psidii MF-1]
MSEEDKIILIPYANLVPVIEICTRLNTCVIPMTNPFQKPQQAFTLVGFSGAHHSRWGGTVTTMCNHPQMGVYGKYSLTPFYGQLDHFGVLWPFSNMTSHWSLMASGHILQPLALFPILHLTNPQANGFFLDLQGASGLPGASGPSTHHQGLWPNPFEYGV